MSEILGTVVGLFVQRQPLKQGRAPLREYRTDDIVAVPTLTVTADGVIGHPADGEPILDVHHRQHPASRDRKGTAGVSVLATADHEWLRERYGAHLADGATGCTVLVDGPALAGRDLSAGLEIHGPDGVLAVELVRVAEPCVEFSRFCLGEPPSPTVSDAVRQALVDLDDGRRGHRGRAVGTGRIALGDVLRMVAPS